MSWTCLGLPDAARAARRLGFKHQRRLGACHELRRRESDDDVHRLAWVVSRPESGRPRAAHSEQLHEHTGYEHRACVQKSGMRVSESMDRLWTGSPERRFIVPAFGVALKSGLEPAVKTHLRGARSRAAVADSGGRLSAVSRWGVAVVWGRTVRTADLARWPARCSGGVEHTHLGEPRRTSANLGASRRTSAHLGASRRTGTAQKCCTNS